ncbi:MAG TPA: maleylpyruvate isomerase family mycothiol-dependent enzyme [Intrasporangium sp.]|uniref:maleylpyruvate isomerase family mycothiol-dependent enzyme n=1 Tax=Intrasporangium sp. TaxID=1925024 RepID=UPI002D7995AC|nr:maleylpyruvate isomerase family mycothiol-dependent enzyme [Intrasporangium sp.]HET7398311.1 maleylpyruvate isomerase family mycothiol-dependent enzyme [Intrasporangium sp.]
MAADDLWRTIHAERAALATDLESLTEDQWRTPSLCAPWTVQQVLAHMTATATMTPPKFLLKMAAAGFRFNAMSEREVATGTTGGPAQTLADFRAHRDDTTAPPGPVDTWLGETIVHAEDIRRPLGIRHDYPVEALARIANFYKGSNLLIGGKRRIDGLHLTATDTAWSTGAGPDVRGPLLALVLAMTGRKAGLAELSGEGVATLAARMKS